MGDTTTYRALVVDDERDARRQMANYLGRHGLICDLAIDGREALALARMYEYDLVMTDLRMPGVNGHKLALELLALERKPVVIVVTAVVEPKISNDLLLRGVDEIIFKPADLNQLAVRALHLVERRRAEIESRVAEGCTVGSGSDASQADAMQSGNTFQRGGLLQNERVALNHGRAANGSFNANENMAVNGSLATNTAVMLIEERPTDSPQSDDSAVRSNGDRLAAVCARETSPRANGVSTNGAAYESKPLNDTMQAAEVSKPTLAKAPTASESSANEPRPSLEPLGVPHVGKLVPREEDGFRATVRHTDVEEIAARLAKLMEQFPKPPNDYDAFAEASGAKIRGSELITQIEHDPQLIVDLLRATNAILYDSSRSVVEMQQALANSHRPATSIVLFAVGVICGWIVQLLLAINWLL